MAKDSGARNAGEVAPAPAPAPTTGIGEVGAAAKGAPASASASAPAWRPETLSAQGLGWEAPPFQDLAPPIHVATTYARDAEGALSGGRMYARDQSPAFDQVEALLARLEGGRAAMVFASGMAAATAVFQTLGPGQRVLAPRAMYWALRGWLLEQGVAWGLEVELYDNGRLEDLAARAHRAPTHLIWVETPANPGWEITDIAGAAAIARAVAAPLVVDSTVAATVHTRPLALGANLVMHSATKYLNGHTDVVAGALVTSEPDGSLWQRLRRVRSGGGAILGSFEAWLLLRGMRTLHLRVRAASDSAHTIAARLARHPGIAEVLYPGLDGHPGHDVAARQMRGGFGAMLSVRVRGGERAAHDLVCALRLFKRATSLGSTESLAEHRAAVEGPGSICPPDLVRLSIGIEHVDDLLADLESALDRIPGR
jgi:cystathionine gamma-synthase